MSTDPYYLEYELSDEKRFILVFASENDRDGCHISLDMYKVQLGPVDEPVMKRILAKFQGEIVTASS
ncbi:MAG: hypothetical protein A2201_13615 [Alicyclobacillus sp. RIFOXYA1_FULL_53_8]|nr:MAG: hypothetical protein A2201_13615 [Alicyclobacillus sp. RIFOXYA1_FULL_53_8]